MCSVSPTRMASLLSPVTRGLPPVGAAGPHPTAKQGRTTVIRRIKAFIEGDIGI